MSKQQLRILHTESSCGWGGQEIRILTEAKGMIERGHQVTILCCPGSNIARVAREYGLPVVELPIEKKRLSSYLTLRSWLNAHRDEVDVINTHSSTDAWLVALVAATSRGIAPMVRTRHVSTHINNAPTTRWLYLQATRHIATTGERLRQQLHSENHYPLSHMTSVATGIDLRRYHPSDKRVVREKLGLPHKPTLGIVATMRSWKGHQYLLRCWQALSLAFPDWQLLLVGDGPQRQALEQQVRDAGLSASVIFLGNRDDVQDCLNCMDVFVLPSYGNEGVPQGVMQAMATALPVVSTQVGAIAEAVEDQKSGFIVAPQNNEQLYERLSLLMSDADLRERMGAAALQRAQQYFGCDRMLDKMDAIFTACAARR